MQPSSSQLEAFDPAAAQALHKVRDISPAEFQALLQLDGLPQDWALEAYTSRSVQQLLVEEVHWQSQAFAQVCPVCAGHSV